MSTDILFRPFEFPKLQLKNRVVMAPMTRSFSPGGVPGDDVVAYYRRRAEGGTGLIISEGTLIDHPAATDDVNVPFFHGEAALVGWKKVIDAVHGAGGKMMPQLWHVGATRRPGTGPCPEAPTVSPSGLVKPGKKLFEPLDIEEIEALVRAYAEAARHAKALGFDGVEIHGAHGYLIDQFFWEGTNQRDDDYGGSLAERTRFGVEVVAAVREAVGDDFPIALRWSQWKQQDFDAKLAYDPDQLATFLAPLSKAGVDIFHCSQRRFWEPEFEGSDMNLAGWTRELTGKPAISVGSVSLNEEFIASFRGTDAGVASIDNLVERMAKGEFDLIAVGRAILANPDWADKVRRGDFDGLKPFTREITRELW